MKEVFLGTLGGILAGAIVAVAIIVAFDITDNGAAFIIGMGCGVLGSYMGTYIMIRKS